MSEIPVNPLKSDSMDASASDPAPANHTVGSPSAIHRLFEPSRDSHVSRNLADDADWGMTLRMTNFRTSSGASGGERRHVQFSEKSRNVLEESNKLVEEVDRIRRHRFSEEPSGSGHGSAPSDSKTGGYLAASTPEPISRYPMHTPRFPRIDFDDMLEEELADRKPAWQQLQENIKTSYRKPKRSVERHRELNELQDTNLNHSYQRRRAALRRSQSPFSHLDGESFIPRAPSWYASGAMQPRGLNPAGSGPYAAPALSSSQGLESEHRPAHYSRYDRLVDDIETRLLRTSILPESMKAVTRREFRRAPLPSSGSAAEDLIADAELGIPLPRTYYSRPDRSDPDYFDFDLQHSIDLFRKPEGVYIPRGPQPWENKIMNEAMAKGDAPLSAYMFTRGGVIDSTPSTSGATAPPPTSLAQRDWRSTGTSYLSAALRTPSFWEHRFTSIGSQVRDSNPISMDSILRNKPVPNKFTEYRDPDFEDYEDPREPE